MFAEEFDTDRADVERALLLARAALKPVLQQTDRTHVGLYAYACLKLGVPADDPALAPAIDRVARACAGADYAASEPDNHAVYVSGIEAMLLADAGGANYRDELAKIRDFIILRQNDHGSWTYTKGQSSDMSVTQYALLGLWAAERAGAKVDPVVWAKSANFLVHYQIDGGFAYSPGSRPDLNMTSAGLGSLIICRKHLANGFLPKSLGASSQRRQRVDESIRYGILRPIVPEEEEPEAPELPVVVPNIKVTTQQIDSGIAAAVGWIDQRFDVMSDKASHLAYWYYTLERAGALAQQDEFRGQDWYDRCADALLPQQTNAGFWDVNSYDTNTDTALIALFLARPTRKLAGSRPAQSIGGGLLSGGRGLPTDLSNFGKPEASDKPQTELEKLLASLAEAEEQALPKLQKQLVEQIQVSDREALIGQHETLAKLLNDPRADVRRTALWAMGRTGDLRLARYPILALDDRDVTVLTEARNALAWIARRPEAFGHPENPLEGLPPGASMEQKKAKVEQWRSGMIKDWGRWYLDASPYADRFDEFDLNLRTRLAR